MFCLFLRGQSTFWGYFFTVGALYHRPIGICCHFGLICPFWGLASMEVRWPQRLLDLIKWHKSASHAKFDHYRTSGSWVMSNLSRKLQMHVPLSFFSFSWLLSILCKLGIVEFSYLLLRAKSVMYFSLILVFLFCFQWSDWPKNKAKFGHFHFEAVIFWIFIKLIFSSDSISSARKVRFRIWWQWKYLWM